MMGERRTEEATIEFLSEGDSTSISSAMFVQRKLAKRKKMQRF